MTKTKDWRIKHLQEMQALCLESEKSATKRGEEKLQAFERGMASGYELAWRFLERTIKMP